MLKFFLLLSLDFQRCNATGVIRHVSAKFPLKTFHGYPPMSGDIEIEILYF